MRCPAGQSADAGADLNLQGDVDCNNAVNSLDAVPILFQVAGVSSVPCAARANVNCTGGSIALDALAIVKYDAGIAPAASGCVAIGSALPDLDGEGLIDAALLAGTDRRQSRRLSTRRTGRSATHSCRRSSTARPQAETYRTKSSSRLQGVSQEVLDELAKYRLPPSNPNSWYYQQSINAAHPAAGDSGSADMTPTSG